MAIVFDWGTAISVLKPLLFFIIGVALYSVFIFKFYRFLARMDIFQLNLAQYNYAQHPFFKKILGSIFYFIEYLLFFPVLVFFWFAVLTTLITFLSKSQPISQILLVSMAIVGAVRMTSYYSEDLSRDLAKMIPFALLAVFIVDVSFFSFSESMDVLKTVPQHFDLLLYYFVFMVALEFLMRILNALFGGKRAKVEEE